MPRKNFTCDPNFPYHLSTRTNNRDWFNLPREIVWQIFSEYLYFIHHAYKVRIHAFVLMDNHFHLIASFPNANLSESMLYFLRETSRCLARQAGRINHIYGTRVFRSKLSSPHYLLNATKYVYRNPVEAGLAKTVESYPHSTLYGVLGQTPLLIPVEEENLIFENPESALKWLNCLPYEEDLQAMRQALRSQEFKLPKCKSSKRLHRLESELY